MSMEIETTTTDMLSSGHATTVQTKDGTPQPREFTTQDTQLLLERDSKSDPECQETELFSMLSTLEHTNTDLESETTTQETTSNGGYSTGEPRPSEPRLTETSLFQSKTEEITGDTGITLLLLSHSETTCSKR